MTKFIKVTNLKDSESIYINIEVIGHIYDVKEKIEYGRVEVEGHTVVGSALTISYRFESCPDYKKK